MVGKFGRFFAFGVRNYGIHPTSKYLKLINNIYLTSLANYFGNYPVWRSIT